VGGYDWVRLSGEVNRKKVIIMGATVNIIINTTTLGDIFTYIGTFLVGYEFVRKLNRLELMLVLVAAWPIGFFIDLFTMFWKKQKIKKKPFSWKYLFQIIYSLIFIIIFLPCSLLSVLFALIVELLNNINSGLNWLWGKIIARFRPVLRQVTIYTLERLNKKYKRYRGIQPKKVVDEIQYREIPFLPIIGIVLITLGLCLNL
jgi:hypothetical protein